MFISGISIIRKICPIFVSSVPSKTRLPHSFNQDKPGPNGKQHFQCSTQMFLCSTLPFKVFVAAPFQFFHLLLSFSLNTTIQLSTQQSNQSHHFFSHKSVAFLFGLMGHSKNKKEEAEKKRFVALSKLSISNFVAFLQFCFGTSLGSKLFLQSFAGRKIF